MSKKWSEEEEKFLVDNYKTLTDEEIGLSLNRTKDSIERKRAKLKLRKNISLDFDKTTIDEILNSNLTYSEIASKFDITYEQARQIFRRNEKKSVSYRRMWTQEEDSLLMSDFETKSDEVLGKDLNRTAIAVFKRRKRLGLIRKERTIFNPPERYWSQSEVDFLLDNFDNISLTEISSKLNRTLQAVTQKASKLGIIQNGSLWSEKEDEVLREHRSLNVNELSFLLNRSQKAIKHRARNLDIKLGDSSHQTTIEKKMACLLEDLNSDFKPQRTLGKEFNYRADFVVGDKVIEVNGDYWHANPIFFPNPNEMQKIMILKDKIKRDYFESMGYSVYEFWEYDINNNYQEVKETVARLLGNF